METSSNEPAAPGTTVQESTAPETGLPALELEPKEEPFQWSQPDWNKARRYVEEGPPPGELTPYETGPVFVSTAPPQLPPAEVEAPQYGTSLAVTGRKVIGFALSEKQFVNDQTINVRPKASRLLDIQQQLQIRMQGKVGPKITVNVDYDDTKENKQDISVVYQGDPQEVVQNAAFGDINLSLPATEFVSYNKQLFGIRADLKYKKLAATIIGSRTKGTTHTKQFFGNTQFETKDIPDTGYIRRQYYDLTFGTGPTSARLPIAAGSEQVFLDPQNPNITGTVNTTQFTADDLNQAAVTYTGRFQRLAPGTDYTVDYQKGILTLRNPTAANFVLVVDLVDANGQRLSLKNGTGRPKILKTSNDLPISSDPLIGAQESGPKRELKTVYQIGRNQIIRDDGRGNFILKVLDQNRAEVGGILNPVQRYPDSITVDFENGLFRLNSHFGDPADPNTPDGQIYAPTPISKRLIHLEYKFRFKTFTLEPSLVLNSETVIIDGAKLTRNVDYFIDYDVGLLSFFNPERIGATSEIDVTYEVAPFGGIGTESLLGGRVGFEVNKHWAVGSTLLYQAGTTPPTTPNVTDLPKSLLVYEADTQFKDLHPFSWLTANFALEVAQSKNNPNLVGFAQIDNMEGAKQTDSAPMDFTLWQIASNPPGSPPADPRSIFWTNADVRVLDINPNAQANPADVQKTLEIHYDFANFGSTEASIVFPFSNSGLDFSQKSFLEVVVFGQNDNFSNMGPQLDFHLGQIDEDADQNGGTTLNCTNGTILVGVPKTEDINCDGLLQTSEDTGWLYSPSGKAAARFGGLNGRIDTSDLNHNGRLDPQDFSGCDAGYAALPAGTPGACPDKLFDTSQGSSITAVNFTGWHTLQIPLNISTDTAQNWAAIRQLRLSLRQTPGGASSGLLRIARVAVVGNAWQQGLVAGGPGTLKVGAVNSVDNPLYVPIFSAGGEAQSVFTDLYGSIQQQQRQTNTANITEQALELRVEGLAPGTTAFTQRNFFRALDISQHKELRFLLYAAVPPTPLPLDGSTTFFLRIGDVNNNFEAQVPLTSALQGWRLVTLSLDDSNGDGIADGVSNKSPFPVIIVTSGTPSLQQVQTFGAGIYNGGATAESGAVWLNELHLAQSRARTGNAAKAQADFDVAGWMAFGAKHRSVDRSFQTPVTVVSNQDNTQDSGYLNFKRISFFPMAFTVQRTLTTTPNVAQTGTTSNLVNLLQQGTVESWHGTGTGNFAYKALPKLSLNYARDYTKYDLLTRKDDRNVYGGALSYAFPGNPRILPRTVDLSYTLTRTKVDFGSALALAQPGDFNTDEISQDYGAKATFSPWTQTTFTPNYALKVTKEKRDDFTTGSPIHNEYPKALSETVGATLNMKLASWLVPSMNYTITNIENNNLSTTTVALPDGTTAQFDVGALKTVNRSANGGITIPLNVGQALPNFKPLRSLNLQASYQLQDGEVLQNVERDLDITRALWIRTPLRPQSPAAQQTNLTLRDTFSSTQRWSPLEAYNIPGRWAPFRTLSVTNNYVLSLQRSEVTGTPSRSRAETLPDLVASLSQVETLLGTQKWMANTILNLKTTYRKTETIDVSLQKERSFGSDLRFVFLRKFDTSLSGNIRTSDSTDLRSGIVTQATNHQDATAQTTFDLHAWRFTPKVDFAHDRTLSGDLVTAETQVITPSVLARADLTLPRGLQLPFGKLVIFTNRIIWTSTLSFAMRRSPVTETDNSNLLNLSTSADYELAKNLRMTLNGSLQRLYHLFLKEEDFIAYQVGTTLTFQF